MNDDILMTLRIQVDMLFEKMGCDKQELATRLKDWLLESQRLQKITRFKGL